MSTTIDQRVVEMRFDNKHFEQNVATTMSTLDKFKHKLHLDGASKGLDGVGNAVETVRTRFSALEVMGVTALANITNSAVNAGKRIVKALTIDPVKTGFNEYELKMDSVKTIMASTGESIETVNSYLEELNKYSDQTIYSFSDMTQNIGKFTNAGVKLEDAVLAIKGISNEAAVSGANATEASRAMYNFAQALSAGYVKLIDWKSIENANMATVEFKQQLIDTAVELGTVTKAADGMYTTLDGNVFNATKNFNEVFQDQWMTTDVLVKTLGRYADETTDIGKKAFAAAQDVTKFSQVFDILKETAQSGWAKTWEIIFGDINQAKALFTPLTEFFSKIINGISDFRNNLLDGALNSPWKAISKKIDESGLGTLKKYTEAAGNLAKTVEHYQEVVGNVWRGDYKNSDTGRYQLLEKDGYDPKVVQELVNKGYKYKLTIKDIEAAQKKYADSTKKAADETSKMSANLEDLSDEQLKNMGFTKEEIALIRELAEEAKRAGVPLSELIETMSKKDGRTLLIESFQNAGQGLVAIFKAIKDAWVEIFPPMTSIQLYNMIVSFNKFSEHLRVSDETADKLRRTLKGVFAILDIITTIVGGAFKFAFKILTQILSYFNLDILDLTAMIGDAIVGFRDWIDSVMDITKIFEKVLPFIKNTVKAIGDWIAGFKETDNIPKYIVEGLINGLVYGVKAVWNAGLEIGKAVLESIKTFLGIHSPSTKFIEVGQNIIAGLVEGLQNGVSIVWELLKTIALKCVEIVKNLDIGTLIAGALVGGVVIAGVKLAGAIEAITSPLDGLGEMFEGIGSALKGWGLKQKSKAIRNMAVAIAILVGSVVVLTFIPTDKLWGAIGALAALTGIIAALAGVAVLLSKAGEINNISVSLLAITGSLLLMAIALNKLSGIDAEKLPTALKAFVGIVGSLLAIVLVFGVMNKLGMSAEVDKVGKMMLKMSIALLLMTFVIKQMAKLDDSTVKRGLSVIAVVGLLFAGVIAVSFFAGENADKAGKMLLKMSIAMLIMVAVIKLSSKLKPGEIVKGISVVLLVGGLFAALVAVSKFAGDNASKAGSMLLKMSIALLVMVAVIKLAAKLDGSELGRALGIIVVIGIIFAALVAVSRLAGKHAEAAGSMLIKMSIALLILSGVIFILGLLNPERLERALGAIVILEACFAGLIAVTKIAKGTKGMKGVLMTMVIAIGLLTASIVALSFIDPKKLGVATAALSAVIAVFGGLIAVTKFAKNTKSMRNTLLQMLGAVLVLALIVAALSLFDATSVLPNAAALSLLMTALSASMVIIGKTGRISSTVSKNLAPMLGVVAGLATILGLMSALDAEASILTATSLSILLNAMAAAMVILGKTSITSKGAVGGLALMGLVVGELGLILGLMSYFNVEPSIETALALTILLNGMAGALAILSKIGPIASLAYPAMLALGVLIAGMGGLLVAIGALVEYVPAVEDFLDNGMVVLEKIGYAIGSFFGNIVGGFIGNVTSGLPDMAEDLANFMEKIQPFIEGAKKIDEQTLAGVKSLAGVILTLTAANLLDGITSWLTGGSDISKFAGELALLGEGIKRFSDAVVGVDPESLSAAASAAKKLAEMTQAIPNEGGVWGWLAGENSISKFAGELVPLGNGIKGFSDAVQGVVPENLTAAANAAKTLAEMTGEIPNEGGVAAWFAGENSISKFASELTPLGEGLKGFSNAVQGVVPENIVAAANAAKALAQMTGDIPNEGGVASWFAGENSISKFAGELVPLGNGLKGFSDAVKGVVPENITAAANAAKAIADMTSNIPNEGGVVSWFAGDNSLSAFAGHFKPLGQGMKAFSDAVKGIDGNNVTAAANAAKTIAGMCSTLPENPMALVAFGEYLKKFGVSLGEYFKSVGKVSVATIDSSLRAINAAKSAASINANNVSEAAHSIEDLAKAIQKLSKIDGGAADGFVQAISNIEQINPDALVKPFKEASGKMKKAGQDLVKQFIAGAKSQNDAMSKAGMESLNKFVDGIKQNVTKTRSACDALVKDCVRAIKNRISLFRSAGADVVAGFASGISANSFKAEAKARAMAKAAAKAAEKALEIKSPSRVFMKIGRYVPEGFAIGIDKMSDVVTASSVDMAKNAIDNVKSSIARMADVVNSDIDTQPTIRPVLDLSDIRSGAGTLSSMLNMGSSVGVLANVRSVSSMMGQYGQNGVNGEVVSAINKLRKDLGNMERPSYNINSITYDDGSNISSAIETLVRAVKIERRT